MSKILNTSGEFYSAVFGEKLTGTYKYSPCSQTSMSATRVWKDFILTWK